MTYDPSRTRAVNTEQHESVVHYYLMRPDKIPVGEHVRPTQKQIVSKEIDELLKETMPVDHRSRHDSVFVMAEPEFSRAGLTYDKGFVHIVKPSNLRGPYDYNWIGVLQSRSGDYTLSPARMSEISRYGGLSDEQIAEKYWNQEESQFPFREFLASEAEIVSHWKEELVLVRSSSSHMGNFRDALSKIRNRF